MERRCCTLIVTWFTKLPAHKHLKDLGLQAERLGDQKTHWLLWIITYQQLTVACSNLWRRSSKKWSRKLRFVLQRISSMIEIRAHQSIQVMALEENVKEFGLTYFGMDDKRQGIVHIIGPENGFTLPGTTVVCGDRQEPTT